MTTTEIKQARKDWEARHKDVFEQIDKVLDNLYKPAFNRITEIIANNK